MVFIWSMTCWLTVEHAKTMLGLVTEVCIVVSDRMLISLLPMSVEPLKVSCAEAADALAPQARDLKAEDLSLSSYVCLQVVKFILNPVLPVCNFLRSLARLRLGVFSVVSPLHYETSLAHFDR